jgi:hypothetical protein
MRDLSQRWLFIFCDCICIHHNDINISITIYRVILRSKNISARERALIIQRYDGYNAYNLFYAKPWRIIAAEAQHYCNTHDGDNPTYNSNLVQSNKVINVLDGKLGMSCISDGLYASIIRSGKYGIKSKVVEFKFVNGKKRAKRTEIISNDKEINKMVKREKIDDLDNCEVTLTWRNKYRETNLVNRQSKIELAPINEFVKVSDQATCVKNPKIYEVLKPPSTTVIRRVVRTSS